MADEAKRVAKLSLKFETTDAVKGMKDVERAGDKVAASQKKIAEEAKGATAAIQEQGRAAEAAAKTIERYGAEALARPESRQARAAARRLDREHDAAIKRVEEYRLAKHYEGLRAQRRARDAEAAELEDLRKTTSSWRKEDSDKYESDMAKARNVGSAAPSASMISQVVATVASVIAIATIVKAVLDEGKARFNIEGNIDTTRQQKDRANLWSPTRYVADFNENRLGITESIRQARQRQARDNVLRGGHWINESMRLEYASQANIARREYGELQGAYVPGIGGSGPFRSQYDRGTVGGERGYQEELQRLPGIDAAADAQRRARAARASVGDAENQLASIERSREQARHRQEQARGRYRTLGAQGLQGSQANVRNPEVEHALADWNAANQDVDRLNQMRVDQIQRIRDLSVNASQAEAQARQRNIDLMRTELSIAEQRTNNLIGAAQRFGAMNPLQQQLSAQALRAVRDRGIRGVTPEVLGLASSLDPQFVGMAQRNAAEANPQFQQLRREGFLDTGAQGTIAQNQAATEQLRQQIREQALESQQQLAEEVSGVLGSTFERILRTFNDRMTALENQFSQQQQNQFNQQ